MDYIDFPYIGTMRAFDGSTFDVQWVKTSEDALVLDVETPFRSGRWDPDFPFDLGRIGEIPSAIPQRSRIKRVPSRVCLDCFVGPDDYWTHGWPTGTPGVTLEADGFATGCDQPTGAAYDYGYDLGYES